jgi:hypothetical protein
MNRAVAMAELDGPDAGLAVLDQLDLGHYRYYHSTRADLLRRSGRDTSVTRSRVAGPVRRLAGISVRGSTYLQMPMEPEGCLPGWETQARGAGQQVAEVQGGRRIRRDIRVRGTPGHRSRRMDRFR